MPEMTAESAAEALAAANRGEEAPAPPAPAAPEPVAPEVPETPDAPEAPAPDQDDATHKAMLDGLPPEARLYVEKREKELQGVMTRKTMELADLRKSAEDDLQFLSDLRTDPYKALEFHQQLTDALIEAGMTPGQAAAEAADQVAEAVSPVSDLDPDDPLAAQVADLTAWKNQQLADKAAEAEQRELDDLSANIQKQELAIRQNNPTYTDQDVDEIYDLAFSPKYGGDLDKAQTAFEAQRSRWATGYVEGKAASSDQAEPLASGAAQVPQKFGSLDEATPAALEYLRNALAQDR